MHYQIIFIPLKWHKQAVTTTGVTVNSSKTEATSVMIGKSLGIPMPPIEILKIEIPTAITRKATAKPNDNAEVYLNESAKSTKHTHIIFIDLPYMLYYEYDT